MCTSFNKVLDYDERESSYTKQGTEGQCWLPRLTGAQKRSGPEHSFEDHVFITIFAPYIIP